MKRITFAALLLSAATLSASEFYKLQQVKRLDSNIYSARNGVQKIIIETRFCFEMTLGSDATLKYEQGAYDNKIFFEDDTTCDVKKVVVQ